MIRSERIQPTLRDRVFPLFRFRNDQTWSAVFLISGSAMLSDDRNAVWLEAPGILWAEASGDRTLLIQAGSEGYHVSIPAQILLNALGHNADSIELRNLANRQLVVSLADRQPAVTSAEQIFRSMLEEDTTSALGMLSMIEANIKTLLVLLWRNTNVYSGHGPHANRRNRVLQHFRQLLETHFRERWMVKDYADAIGISVDRLHEICTGTLGRTPLHLAHERAMFEAKQLLVNTTLNIEQISNRLGFRDPSHFSKHFKQWTGLPPKDFRSGVSNPGESDQEAVLSDYAEWP